MKVSALFIKEIGWDNVHASDPVSEKTSQVLFTAGV